MKYWIGSFVAITSILLTSVSYGQIEEVTVTAQKREERLQETPISITAFTEETLEEAGINDTSKLADFAPNVIFDSTTPISGTSNGAAIFIRGVGQLDFGLTTDPGVGTYIDGVYSSRAIGGVLDVVDIERIEILRGSQGTLFGRNTIGGAINITTKKPAEEFGGFAGATLGNFDRTDFKGSIDLPFSQKFLTKLSFYSKRRDGYVNRTLVGDKLGNENRRFLRGSFLFSPRDDLELYGTLDYTDIDERSAGSVLVGITESAGNPDLGLAPSSTFAYNQFFVPQNPGAVPYDERFLFGGKNDRTSATGPTGTDLEGFGTTMTLTWSLSSLLELKSITAYRDTDGGFFRDPDGAPFAITETSNPNYSHEQFSEELQIIGTLWDARLQYVVGAYFFEEEGTDDVFVPIFSLPPPSNPPMAFQAYINNFATVDNSSRAVFGQGTYDLTDRLAATVGLRYTKDKKGYGFRQFLSADPEGDVFLLPLIGPRDGDGTGLASSEFDKLNVRAGLEYQFNDDTLFYFIYSDGFKSGGFNFRYVVPRVDPLPFEPETLGAFEVGVKWQGWNDRLRVNGAGFVSEYKNVQVQLFETGGGPLTQNAGNADIFGLELEATVAPTDRVLLNAGLGYTNAEYAELNLPTTDVAQPVNLNTKLPNTPEITLNLSGIYNHSLEWGTLTLRGDYRYTDDLFNDAQNSPFLFQESYQTINASVTFTPVSDSFAITVFGTNLTDERYITSGDSNFGLGFHEANYSRPREFGVTIRNRFQF